MSTLQLDRSDPGVDEMVSAWKDGATYKVMLTINQKSSSPNVANFEVMEVVNESEEAAAGEPAGEETSPQNSTRKAPTEAPVKVTY